MVFKLKLDIINFDKLKSIPDKLKKITKQSENLKKSVDTGSKSVSLLGIAGNKMGSLISLGIKKIGLALKTLGIGLIIAAVAALVKLGKILFAFNIGGVGESFFKIVGKLKDTLGKFMQGLMKFSQALEPVIKPLVDFLTNTILKAIDSSVKLFKTIGKHLGGTKGAVKMIGNLFNALKMLFTEVSKAFKDVISGFGSNGEFAKGLATIVKGLFMVLTVTIKIVTITYKILSFLKIFKIIGLTLRIIFWALLLPFKKMNESIERLTDKKSWAGIMDFFKLLKTILKAITGDLESIKELKESFSIKGLKDKAKEKRQSRLETIRPFLEKIGIGSGDSGTVNNTQNVSVNTQSIDSSSTKGLGNMLSNLFNSKNKLGY